MVRDVRRCQYGVAPPLSESKITHYTPPSSSLRARLTQHSAPVACPLYPPTQQPSGNRRSCDREGWQPPEVYQRHRERRHESTADDGARDDLPIAVASHESVCRKGSTMSTITK